MQIKRGDTLVEVVFAIAIFALVAIISINAMNGGLSVAQQSLEITMTRNEMDAQAEALRFVHNAFALERELVVEKQQYRDLWYKLTRDSNSGIEPGMANTPDALPELAVTSCNQIYENGGGKSIIGNNDLTAFVMNTRAIDPDDKTFAPTITNEGARLDQIVVSTKVSNADLFKSNDLFSMAKYSKQFVKGNRLDNGEKLGWEFNVDGIYFDKANNKYTGVITLTRVDNTRTEFTATSKMSNSVTQPSGDTNEIGNAIFDDENILMNYAFNNSSVYSTDKALSTKGIELFGDTNGNGGSLEISIKDKDGYNCYINSIKLVYCVLTSGTLKVTANGNDLEFTRFTGPLCAEGATDGEGNPMNDSGRFYQVNAKKVKIQNAFTGTINHYSDITIVSMEIEYTMMPNN